MNKNVLIIFSLLLSSLIFSCDSKLAYDANVVYQEQKESDWQLASLAAKQFFIGNQSVITNQNLGKPIQSIKIPLPKPQKIKNNLIFELFDSPDYLNFTDLSLKLSKDSLIQEIILDVFVERENELKLLKEDIRFFLEKRLGKEQEIKDYLFWKKNNAQIYLYTSDQIDLGIRIIVR